VVQTACQGFLFLSQPPDKKINTLITTCSDDTSPHPTVSYSQIYREKTMMDKPPPNVELYEIRLKGHLDAQWVTWFDSLTITLEENGDTLLSGPVADQAALHGLFKKIRDLGVTLISVNRAKADHPDASDVEHPINIVHKKEKER
jgi:hypothetical protein